MNRPFRRIVAIDTPYGVTGFRLQSAICSIVILSVAVLLRISSTLWAIAARCVEADEFWFEPYKSAWPVGGVFFLVLFLLLIWNLFILVNQAVRGRVDLFLSAVNFIGIFGLFWLSMPVFQAADFEYDSRKATYGDWLVSNNSYWPWYEDPCALATDYVGHWNVVERKLPPYGIRFPALWIELRQSLTVRALDSNWAGPVEGHWSPPSFGKVRREKYRGQGNIYLPDGYSYWQFDLKGNTLTLTTPEWVDWHEPALVILEREGSAD